ncbi:MAG: hypothetical protein LBN93_01920, partial [Candidatus Symbiothrix sp.]|nr:hypothetical protein [Candidatus Symbiothrix sp.]
MTKKLIFSALCFFAALTLSAQTYSGGSGTEADPYLISSNADMAALATATNGNSSYSTGKYFLLTQDITEAVTTIIGNSDSRTFKGIFDGGGHSIGVSISTTTVSYAGVFGNIFGATIKNLGVTGSITRASAASSAYVGGICGIAQGSSTISNCYNTASISATTTNSSSYGAYVGGICGFAQSGSVISNCYNTGNVTASGNPSFTYAGGICGYFIGRKISNCIAANTSITTGTVAYAGRIVGIFSSSASAIENCNASASMLVNGTTRSSTNANSEDGKDLFGTEEILNTIGTLNAKYIAYGDILNINEGNLPINFQVSDNNIAEIAGSVLTAKKIGNVVITANYNYESVDYQFEIPQIVNKAQLTIQADTLSMIYGETPPQYTCHYSGFVNNETESVLTKLPAFSCSGTSASNVGNYTITPSGAEAENYSFTYKNGQLQIGKRDLQVIPDNLSRVYGDNNPALTLSYNGFVNGNTASNISTKPTATTVATKTSPVGNYEITCSGGSNLTNYQYVYEKGNLEIAPAPLTVTADGKSRYWGVENPVLTFTYSGFKNNENQSVLTETPQISCTAERLSPSGQYPITVSGGAAPNYEIIRVNSILTVEKDSQMATVKLNFSNPHIIQGMNTALQVTVEQEDPLVSFQTDITFPDFVTVDLDNVSLSNRCNNAHILDAVRVSSNPNKYRFLIYSPSNALIAGNSGTLLTIPMTIDWKVCPAAYSYYPVSTSATTAITFLSESEKPEKTLANTSSTFATHKLGDADVDGRISISDIVTDVDYRLGKNPAPFLFEAGDMDANQAIDVADLTPLSDTILVQIPFLNNEGFENGTNDWVIVNGSQTNKWYRGTATAHSGSYSMYISNNSSANSYSTTSSSIVHFYRDITVGANDKISFYWKGVGESNYDYLTVYLVSTTTTPTAGTSISTGYSLGTYYGNSSWQQATITIPASQAGNKRLVFSWRNNSNAGSNPPIAIDNIEFSFLQPNTKAMVSANFSHPNVVTNMSTDLLLTLDNDEPILAFQTDVTLPSFVSMNINNMVLSDRCNNSYTARAKKVSSSPNTYRVHIYSTNNTPIAADSSRLISLPLQIDWTAISATYANYTVSTAYTSAVFYLSETDKPEKAIANTSTTFYIHRMGDVNINGTVTISDIVAEVDYILGKNPQPFLFEAGDMNHNNAISILDLTQ